MKIAVFVNTQAEVHFYKNIVAALERDSNQVFVLARGYGGTIELLKELNIPFFLFSGSSDSKSGKITSVPHDVVNAFRYLKAKNIDLTTGCGTYSTFTARLLKVPDITFNDAEGTIDAERYAMLKLTYEFTDVFVTPSSFKQELGSKHLKVESYKELAYLHPHYYTPDPSVFDLLGISKSHDYSVLRFNAFDCSNDLGVRGLTDTDKIALVKELSDYGAVFVSSECGVPEPLRDYVLNVPKRRIHDVLSYASLFITDTHSMATEAALLGTPTIRSNAFVGECDVGALIELEREFKLLFNLRTASEVRAKAVQLIKDPHTKEDWQKKRGRLLEGTLDMTALMVSLIEAFPASFAHLKATAALRSIPLLE
jgi:predicted glycosyltransferase